MAPPGWTNAGSMMVRTGALRQEDLALSRGSRPVWMEEPHWWGERRGRAAGSQSGEPGGGHSKTWPHPGRRGDRGWILQLW